MSMSSPRILPAGSHQPYQWLNGKGVASEIARYPSGQDDFDWKVSIATVVVDGPFSSMPGLDRVLIPLSEGGLKLLVDGEPLELGRWQVHEFRGETAVEALDVSHPTIDLNLIVRRSEVRGSVEVVKATDPTVRSAHHTVVVVLEGHLSLGDQTLHVLDAVLLGAGESVTLSGSGTFAVATMTPSHE
jgi:hypothetical protein